MGLFSFINEAKEKARLRREEEEQQLLMQPNTAKATVVEVLVHHTSEWQDSADGGRNVVEEDWAKPVVSFEVNGITVRSEVGQPNEWTETGRTSIYPVGSKVIVRYQPQDLSWCTILRRCVNQ